LLPIILAEIFDIPAKSRIVLMTPPAIMPEPNGAGLRNNIADPLLTRIS